MALRRTSVQRSRRKRTARATRIRSRLKPRPRRKHLTPNPTRSLHTGRSPSVSGDRTSRRMDRRASASRRKPSVRAVGLPAIWERRAYRAGILDGREAVAAQSSLKKTMSTFWNRWLSARRLRGMPWNRYRELSSAYAQGFGIGTNMSSANDWVPMPTLRSTAAVVTVMNEAATLPAVLQQLVRLAFDEVIVIVNGSTDDSFRLARQCSEAIIVHYPQPLGHDVGRAVGAKISTAEIVLFMDGDFPIRAEELVPFIGEIERGCDIAVNRLTPLFGKFNQRDAVSVMKEFLNRCLGHSHERFGADSLTAVPHAMSRHALKTIGYHMLAIPPKAYVIAATSGLNITAPLSVDVISNNKARGKWNIGTTNPVADLIIGDHAEAIHWLMSSSGNPRYTFEDQRRMRSVVTGG